MAVRKQSGGGDISEPRRPPLPKQPVKHPGWQKQEMGEGVPWERFPRRCWSSRLGVNQTDPVTAEKPPQSLKGAVGR